MARLKDQICYACQTSVHRPSIRCLSRDHISETEKDRPIVTMGHYIVVGIADSVAARRSSQTPLGDTLVSKKYVQILVRLIVRLVVRPQLSNSAVYSLFVLSLSFFDE